MEQIDSIWFYTLSTTAQSMAAILSLLVIFLITRLEQRLRDMNDYHNRAIMYITHHTNRRCPYSENQDSLRILSIPKIVEIFQKVLDWRKSGDGQGLQMAYGNIQAPNGDSIDELDANLLAKNHTEAVATKSSLAWVTICLSIPIAASLILLVIPRNNFGNYFQITLGIVVGLSLLGMLLSLFNILSIKIETIQTPPKQSIWEECKKRWGQLKK